MCLTKYIILTIKLNLLKEYKSEQEIINQLKSNNGDWFKSNNNKTNYIEHEWLSKYNPKKDITKYVACYDKLFNNNNLPL